MVHIVEIVDEPLITTHRKPEHWGVFTIRGDIINPIIVFGVQNLVYKLDATWCAIIHPP